MQCEHRVGGRLELQTRRTSAQKSWGAGRGSLGKCKSKFRTETQRPQHWRDGQKKDTRRQQWGLEQCTWEQAKEEASVRVTRQKSSPATLCLTPDALNLYSCSYKTLLICSCAQRSWVISQHTISSDNHWEGVQSSLLVAIVRSIITFLIMANWKLSIFFIFPAMELF